MICKNCNTENLDTSVYCKSCGTRIDGKKVCPSCNFANKETDTFCSKCGARIDGKKFCANCGCEVEGEYCTTCGQKFSHKAMKKALKVNGTTSHINKILDTVGSSILMLGVALSVMFIFFIGINGTLDEGNGIFYYFGKAYEDLKSMYLDYTRFFSASEVIAAYTSTIAMTIIAVACMVCNLVFAILAIVRFVKKLCFGEEKSSETFSLLAIFFYILCAVSFKNLLYVSGTGDLKLIESLTATKLNDITSTGLTL